MTSDEFVAPKKRISQITLKKVAWALGGCVSQKKRVCAPWPHRDDQTPSIHPYPRHVRVYLCDSARDGFVASPDVYWYRDGESYLFSGTLKQAHKYVARKLKRAGVVLPCAVNAGKTKP